MALKDSPSLDDYCTNVWLLFTVAFKFLMVVWCCMPFCIIIRSFSWCIYPCVGSLMRTNAQICGFWRFWPTHPSIFAKSVVEQPCEDDRQASKRVRSKLFLQVQTKARNSSDSLWQWPTSKAGLWTCHGCPSNCIQLYVGFIAMFLVFLPWSSRGVEAGKVQYYQRSLSVEEALRGHVAGASAGMDEKWWFPIWVLVKWNNFVADQSHLK